MSGCPAHERHLLPYRVKRARWDALIDGRHSAWLTAYPDGLLMPRLNDWLRFSHAFGNSEVAVATWPEWTRGGIARRLAKKERARARGLTR